MRKLLIAIGLVLVPVFLAGQSTMIRDGASARLATVDANKNVRISIGAAGTRTFNIFFVSDPASIPNLTVSAGQRRGFRVKRWCFSFSSATAASVIRAQLRRIENISSGNLLTVQAPMAQGDGEFDGFVTSNGSVNQGAMLSDLTVQTGEIGVGAADYPAGAPQCVSYLPYEMPRATPGQKDGFQLTIFTSGAGTLAAATMSMTIVLDDEESK